MARLGGAVLVLVLLVGGCADGDQRAVASAGPASRLTVHPVLGTTDDQTVTQPDQLDPAVDSSVPDPDGGAPLALGPAALTRDDVADAAASPGSPEGLVDSVVLDWTPAGAERWSALTGRAACAPPGDPARRIAILLDGVVLSAPVVDAAVGCDVGIVGGSTQLSGPFTAAEAERIVASLRAADD